MKQVRDAPREILRHHLTHDDERTRLVRFCRRLTGDADVAEDLAQDALIEAWRQAETLKNPQVWRTWLHGIARNMYLRWQRSSDRERSRRITTADGVNIALMESRPDETPDFSTILEREEIGLLLGRAMKSLPPQTRQLLIQHYIEEIPQGEIAARLGVTENTAAVRLHRGKQTLRRVLTQEMRDEAMAYGLLPPEHEGWQETRLWCPICGKQRLVAGPGRIQDPNFRLTCRGCYFVMGPRRTDFPSDCIFGHHALDTSRMLENIHGYKPALNRMTGFYQDYLKQGQERGQMRCIGCGTVLPVSSARPAHLKPVRFAGFHIHCDNCLKIHVLLPTAFAFCSPQYQEFWRQNPRLRFLPIREIPGTSSFLLTAESVTDCARLEMVFHAETYQIIETRPQ
jgi:RNA polymerase sigma factor (sigma-70 family)